MEVSLPSMLLHYHLVGWREGRTSSL